MKNKSSNYSQFIIHTVCLVECVISGPLTAVGVFDYFETRRFVDKSLGSSRWFIASEDSVANPSGKIILSCSRLCSNMLQHHSVFAVATIMNFNGQFCIHKFAIKLVHICVDSYELRFQLPGPLPFLFEYFLFFSCLLRSSIFCLLLPSAFTIFIFLLFSFLSFLTLFPFSSF